MRLIRSDTCGLGKRAAWLFAFDFLSLMVVLAVVARFPRTGTIEGSTDNPWLLLLRIALLLLYELFAWAWVVRPCRSNLQHHIFAWFILLMSNAIFCAVPLVLDTDTINRMIVRTSYSRAVLAREYSWEATTGGGKYTPRRTYMATGLLFADANSHGVERVQDLGGPPGNGATCFVEHEGWLGWRWISDVHACDLPVEHIQLVQLRDGNDSLVDHPGAQCLDDEPAEASPPDATTGNTLRCPLIVDEGQRWVAMTTGALQRELVALPLPHGYWIEPKVASVSPDGNRILIGDARLRNQLFLWNRQTGQWLALLPPESFMYMQNVYVLNDDASVIMDCPNGLTTVCKQWVMPEKRKS